MQDEFDAHYPAANIQISGINEFGFTDNIDGFTEGRNMPFLQDTDADNNGASDVWTDSWAVTYRDVMVLDANNEPVFTFNVTSSSLSDSANYSSVKNAFIGAIVPNANTIWQNPIEPLNVTGDDVIDPLDALLVINALSDYPDGTLPASIGNQAPFLDADGNGVLSPVDPLIVINQLTTNSKASNGLSAGITAPLSYDASTAVTEPQIALPTMELASTTREVVVDELMATLDDSTPAAVIDQLPTESTVASVLLDASDVRREESSAVESSTTSFKSIELSFRS